MTREMIIKFGEKNPISIDFLLGILEDARATTLQ